MIGHFLPMWAKQTVLADNRHLLRQKRELEQEVMQLKAYIRGMQTGLRATKRVHGEEKA